MNRTLIECPLCPCVFLTRTDLERHMAGFTDNAVDHIRLYADNLSYPLKLKRKRRRELYREYLRDKGVAFRPRPKRPRREALSLGQMQAKYASKLGSFRVNYCRSGVPVNRPPRRPSREDSWLSEAGKEGQR